jgi:hypothetical protein
MLPPGGEPGEELVRAAAGAGPDQGPAAEPARKLRQRQPRGGDVVGVGVVG